MLWSILIIIAMVLWGVRSLMDAYCVEDVFSRPLHGLLTSGLFAVIGVVSCWFIGRVIFGMDFSFTATDYHYRTLPIFGEVTLPWQALSFGAGMLFCMHYYALFRFLFRINDVVIAETLSNATVLLTPLWTLLYEADAVTAVQWVGVALVFVATGYAIASNMRRHTDPWSVLWRALLVIITVTASMMLQRIALQMHDSDTMTVTFTVESLFHFYIGMLSFGLLGALFYKESYSFMRPRVGFLTLAEIVDLLGTAFFQAGLMIAPALALVSALEASMPLVLLVFAAILLGYTRLVKYHYVCEDIAVVQLHYARQKIIATMLLCVGVLCIFI